MLSFNISKTYWKSTFAFLIISGLSHFNSIAQYQIDRYYPDLKIDTLWVLPEGVGIGSGGAFYLFRGDDLQAIEKTIARSTEPEFFFQDSIINAYATFRNGFLISMGKRLYFYDGSEPRQFTDLMGGSLENIDNIASCGDDFAVISEGEMWIWDHDLNGFSQVKIPASVNIMARQCDPWGGFWASDGKDLYSISGQVTSQALPTIHLAVNLPEIENKSPIKIQTDKEIEFAVFAAHTRWKKLKVEYQLENASNEWINIENNKTITLKSDSSGIFMLRARATIDEKYYAYSDGIQIVVIPAENSPLWFLLLLPLMIFISAWYILARERKHRKTIQGEIEKYQLKAEAREWENKANQLKMNPHFIFNSLTGIQGLIATGENDKARSFLSRFSTLMRYLLKEGSMDQIPLEDEVRFLEDYLTLEQMSRDGKFDFDIVNDAEEDIRIPPMLVQPLVENALVHGFKGINYKGKLQLKFSNDDHFLYCTVTDNGIGMNKAGKGIPNSEHNALALSIIKKRLHSLNRFRKGDLVIEDLSGINDVDSGTRSRISIPI